MFGIVVFWLFVVSGSIMNVLPGPDSLYVVGRGASQGFRAGAVAALGIGAGTFVHIFAAAFGLSAILATSAHAFTGVKIIGCIYLLYMGFTMVFGKSNKQNIATTIKEIDSLSKVFYKGFLTNVLNPKVALFFLAFVPQFISFDAENKALAFIILGLVFNMGGMIWLHLLAWSSSSLGARIRRNSTLAKWLKRAAGGLFVYFGLRLAFSSQS